MEASHESTLYATSVVGLQVLKPKWCEVDGRNASQARKDVCVRYNTNVRGEWTVQAASAKCTNAENYAMEGIGNVSRSHSKRGPIVG